MPRKIPLLDANIIIRFILADNKAQSDKIKRLFQNASKKSLEINDITFAEINFVLQKVYSLPKEDIIDKINKIINFDKVKVNKKLLKKTLALYSMYPISFVDAYLCALAGLQKNESIYTFDKKILSIKNIKAQTPL